MLQRAKSRVFPCCVARDWGAAARQIQNVAIGVVGDGVADTDVPGVVEVVVGRSKLAEIVIGVLYGIIRRLSRPVVIEADRFNPAINIAGSAAPAGRVSEVLGEASNIPTSSRQHQA